MGSLAPEAGFEVGFDVFPSAVHGEAGWGVAVELKGGETGDEFGGLFGVLFDFFERSFIFDAFSEAVAEADFFADIDPVGFAEFGHGGEGGFAVVFEVIVPDGGDGEVVVIPEFAFVFGAVGTKGGMTGADGVGFAIFVEEVGKADFKENVVIFDILFEFFFVLNDGVVEGDAVGADDIRVDDIIVLGVGVTHSHGLIPDFLTIRWFDVHAGDDGCEEQYYYCDEANCAGYFGFFVHFPPLDFLDLVDLVDLFGLADLADLGDLLVWVDDSGGVVLVALTALAPLVVLAVLAARFLRYFSLIIIT